MGPQQIWSNLRMSRKVNRQEKRDQGVSWDKVLCKHSGVAREPGAFWGWTKDRVWAAKRLKTMPVTEDNQFTFRSDKTKQDARSPAFPHKSLERIKSSPRPSSPWIPTVCQAPKRLPGQCQQGLTAFKSRGCSSPTAMATSSPAVVSTLGRGRRVERECSASPKPWQSNYYVSHWRRNAAGNCAFRGRKMLSPGFIDTPLLFTFCPSDRFTRELLKMSPCLLY